MDQRKARKLVAETVAAFARERATAFAGNTGATNALEYSADDRDRLYRAFDALASELARRAGLPHLPAPIDPDQISLFDESEATP